MVVIDKMKLKVKTLEDLFIPPLKEFSYLCDGILSEVKCKGIEIYRDEDFISFNINDVLSSLSLQSLVRMKTRGRKRDRWLNYINKYKIELEPKEFSLILKLGALFTVYVDGYEIDGTQGDVVIKEFRVTGTGSNVEHIIKVLKEMTPRLIVHEIKQNIWYMITAYKVPYIDNQLKKLDKLFLNSDRLECKELNEDLEMRICRI